MSLSNPSSDMETSESSNRFSTQQLTPFLDLFDFVSELLLSVSDSGSIVSKSSTSTLFSAPQQTLLLELSDSDSVLSFSTSSSDPRIPESPVKLELLVDLLSRLGSNLSLCHKLHLAISPSILHQFSRSQWLRKALEKTFRSVPVTSRGDQ